MKYKGIQSADLQAKAQVEVNEFTIKFINQNVRKIRKIADNQFKTKFGWKFLKLRFFKKYHQKNQIKLRLPEIDFAEAVEINIKSSVFLTVRFKIRYKNEDDFKYIFINFTATKKAYKTDAKAVFKFNPMSIRFKNQIA